MDIEEFYKKKEQMNLDEFLKKKGVTKCPPDPRSDLEAARVFIAHPLTQKLREQKKTDFEVYTERRKFHQQLKKSKCQPPTKKS